MLVTTDSVKKRRLHDKRIERNRTDQKRPTLATIVLRLIPSQQNRPISLHELNQTSHTWITIALHSAMIITSFKVMINQVVTNQTDQLVYTNRTYSTRLIIGLHSALIITSVKVVTNQTDQPIYTNRNYNTWLTIALYSAPMITCVQVVERRSIRHSLQYLSHPHDEITELINKQI